MLLWGCRHAGPPQAPGSSSYPEPGTPVLGLDEFNRDGWSGHTAGSKHQCRSSSQQQVTLSTLARNCPLNCHGEHLVCSAHDLMQNMNLLGFQNVGPREYLLALSSMNPRVSPFLACHPSSWHGEAPFPSMQFKWWSPRSLELQEVLAGWVHFTPRSLKQCREAVPWGNPRRLGKGLVLEPEWVRMPFWAGRVQLSAQQVDKQCPQHLPASLF